MATQAKIKWVIDPSHSEIGFKAKHLMITTVSGKFEKCSGSVETNGDDLTTAQISFTAETGSVNTGSADRDAHIRNADFFDAEKFPEMKFTSSKLEKLNSSEYKLHGHLTIREVTSPVQLNVEFNGIAKDPWGNTKAGFIINGKINRKQWGLNWNLALEAGGVLVSEEVMIHCEVQLLQSAT